MFEWLGFNSLFASKPSNQHFIDQHNEYVKRRMMIESIKWEMKGLTHDDAIAFIHEYARNKNES